MENFIKIIKKVSPSFIVDEIQTPFRELAIDSLDLVAIRVEIDKYIGYEILESKWYEFENFQDVFSHIRTQKKSSTKAYEIIHHTVKRELLIGMPQMANSALSENWLFKEIGDIHWELLCIGLNTKSGSITDENGNRLYATFTRIQIDCSPLSKFKENQPISLDGTINRFGNLTYISKIMGKSGHEPLSAIMMTSFSKRGGGDNLDLIKSQPFVSKNSIGEIKNTPPFFNDYRLMRKGLMMDYLLGDIPFDLDKTFDFELAYDINPYYDINGVGLIYFAAYPIISDFCEAKYFNCLDNIQNWATEYKTIARDIFYYANCNPTDRIVYKLNQFDFYTEDRVKISSTLVRQSDGVIMAHIFTLKERQKLEKIEKLRPTKAKKT